MLWYCTMSPPAAEPDLKEQPEHTEYENITSISPDVRDPRGPYCQPRHVRGRARNACLISPGNGLLAVDRVGGKSQGRPAHRLPLFARLSKLGQWRLFLLPRCQSTCTWKVITFYFNGFIFVAVLRSKHISVLLLVSGPSLFMTLQLSDYILQSKIAALGRQIESRGASPEDEYSTFGIDAHRST